MSSFSFADPEVVAEVSPNSSNNMFQFYYFTDPEVVAELSPTLVKSILKNGRNTTELKSKKKVMFSDKLKRRFFCIEEGRSLKPTKALVLHQKQQMKIRRETRIKRDNEIKKELGCLEDEESPQSDEDLMNELQELCGED